MADPTVIGRATFVRGRITGSGDLEINGRVEGDVTCSGEVLVEATGLVGANVSARRIVVRGAVRGDLVAEDIVVVEAGAKIVGDLKAPRITIASGGLVRGNVQTGAAGAPRPRTQAQQVTKPAPKPVAVAVKAPPPPPPPARSAPTTTKATNGPAARGSAISGARLGPPAPVVPVLKKGTKAIQKKR